MRVHGLRRSVVVPVVAVVGMLGGPGGFDIPAARAEPPASPMAISVNAPWGWFGGDFGASLSVAIGEHHAVRANAAHYEEDPLLEAFANAVIGRDIPYRGGERSDYGLGWVWYPRQMWSGLQLEAGAIRRDRATVHRLDGPGSELETHSTTYATRGMIGWTWLIRQRVVVAVAVGLSAGREAGTETTVPEIPGEMSTTRSIARLRVDGEAYFRVGLAFGR